MQICVKSSCIILEASNNHAYVLLKLCFLLISCSPNPKPLKVIKICTDLIQQCSFKFTFIKSYSISKVTKAVLYPNQVWKMHLFFMLTEQLILVHYSELNQSDLTYALAKCK